MKDLIAQLFSDLAELLDVSPVGFSITVKQGSSVKTVSDDNAESLMKPHGWVVPWVTYGSQDYKLYSILLNGRTVHSFWLAPLPGSCATLIETQVKTGSGFTRKGIGTRCYAFRRDLARHYKYSALMGTATTKGNAGEIKIAERAGAQIGPKFVNRRYSGKHGSEINVIVDPLHDDSPEATT